MQGNVFFFSSRRRHTRSLCDWSSDVCSSDLRAVPAATEEGRRRRMENIVVRYLEHPKLTDPIFVEGLPGIGRSEEHTSELQSHSDLVCRLLLEKKKKKRKKEQEKNIEQVHTC